VSAPLIWLTRQGVLQDMSDGYIWGPTDLQLWHNPQRACVVVALSRLQMLICGPGTKFLGRFDVSRRNVELEASTWLAHGKRVEDHDTADVFEVSVSNTMDDPATTKSWRQRQTKSDVRHLQANLQNFLNLLSFFVNFLVGAHIRVTRQSPIQSVQLYTGMLST